MPYKGYKSITVKEEVYNRLWAVWEERREEYLRQGITSFSGFVTRFLYELVEREERRTQRP